MYLVKLEEVLSFMNKTKQIYKLDIFSQRTEKHKQKIKKEFGNSLDLQWQDLFTEPITKPIMEISVKLLTLQWNYNTSRNNVRKSF